MIRLFRSPRERERASRHRRSIARALPPVQVTPQDVPRALQCEAERVVGVQRVEASSPGRGEDAGCAVEEVLAKGGGLQHRAGDSGGVGVGINPTSGELG